MTSIMGFLAWVVGVATSLVASKKSFLATGFVTGGTGALIVFANAAYSDKRLADHVAEQARTNSRVERGLETVNGNLFSLQIAILTRKEQELEKIEEKKEKK